MLGLVPSIDTITSIDSHHMGALDDADFSWIGLNGLWQLSRRAATAATFGFSWRDHYVGAASYAIDRQTCRIGVLAGFNFKPESGDATVNNHAEQVNLTKVRKYGFPAITTIAVWGQPQEDEESGRLPETAHPCSLCRRLLAAAEEVDNQTTAILSTNTDFTKCELYNLTELNEYHAGQDVSLRGFSLAETAYLRPVRESDGLISWQTNPDFEEELNFRLLEAWAAFNPQARYADAFRQWFAEGQPGRLS